MNPRKWLLWLVFAFSATALPAAVDSGIEFSGVLIMVDKTTVHLASKAGGQTRWVALGETFDGYVVSAYEPKPQMLVLTKGGATLRLHLLPTAKAKDGAAAVRTAVTKNLEQIRGAAESFYLRTNKPTATLADLAETLKPLTSVDGEDYARLELKRGQPISITTASGITVTIPQ